MRNAAESANNGFCTNDVASFFGSFEPCGPQPWPAQARKRAPQAAPRRLRPEYQALCHSERSEESFSLANQRPRTDYAEQGGERQTKCSQTSVSSAYRFFVALLLRMTKQEELRVAQRVGTVLFIVRKLRGRLEYATGGNAERWREKMFGAAAACRDKHRRSAVRAEALPCGSSQILAPLASARKQLHYRSTMSDKKPVSLPNQNRKLVAAHATLRIVKLSKTGGKQPQRTNSFNPPAPRHYAASGLLNLLPL